MVNVLVVDDSSFMRKSITHILKSDPSICVIGTAGDGKECVRKVKQLHPDVVLLDIEMPVMDGLAALAHIMAECPTPVVMLSALNRRDATIAIKSLEYGAVDFIPKPSGTISYDIETLSDEIIANVKIAADVDVRRIGFHIPAQSYLRGVPSPERRKKMVIIGASTGGPRSVDRILSELPRSISVAVLVVQHIHPEFIPSFVERLQCRSPLDISTAQKDDIITPGQVLVAPGGCHTTIVQNDSFRKIRLNRRKSLHTPSIDMAMESAADAYGEDVLGVLLTGVGDDGARGMKAIKDAGGSTIAEDQSTCMVFGMPKAAIELGCVDEIVPLPQVAKTILRMI